MKLPYKRLWVMLAEQDMKKAEPAKNTKISSASQAKLGRRSNVTTDVLVKICKKQKCDITDICEIIPDNAIDDKAGS